MDKEKREPDKPKPRAKASLKWELLPCFLRDAYYQKTILLIGVSLIISFLLTPSYMGGNPPYRLGDVADRNIKSDREVLIEDTDATARKRSEAVRQAPLVYELDEKVGSEVLERLETAFQSMREYSEDKVRKEDGSAAPAEASSEVAFLPGLAPPGDILDPIQSALQKKRFFSNPLGIQISDEIFSDLSEKNFSQDLQEKISKLLTSIFEQGIVSSKAWRLPDKGENLLIRKAQTQQESFLPPPHSYMDIEEARKFAMMQAFEYGSDTREVRTIAFLASQLLQPNLTFEATETERLKDQAYASIKPVYIHLMRNEMLVREGQRIGPEEILKLRAIEEGKPRRHTSVVFTAMFFFTCICIWVVVHVTKQHLPSFGMEVRDLLFLGALLVFLLTLGRSVVGLGDSLWDGSTQLATRAIMLAIPLAAGPMIASIFFDVTTAIIYSLLLTLFAGILFEKDFALFLYFLIGSFVAVHGVAKCRNRMIPIKAGLLVGCTNVVLIVLNALLQDQVMVLRTVGNAFFGFCGGLFAGVLATGLTPLVEILFSYTTDIKLLELATMDQPLMQELMVQAPGTYHHSIIVGNMVEAAAKSIGANSLLAKVAAYYHDIGKIRKPLYFIENQFDCENRHEKLAPSMSSLILISHVKEGVELARHHRLGKAIIDIISQHHGKSFISFFYKKAVEGREKLKSTKGAELPPVNMEDYRYPGPKPQTKEAGLVMLADVVEAACRSLTDPTPARIQGMVNRLINNIFSDGQLDDCELTLKDLHQIAKHFNQILATVHHKRIEYPALPAYEAKGKTDGADSNQREPKADKDKPNSAGEIGRRDLKRLGIH